MHFLHTDAMAVIRATDRAHAGLRRLAKQRHVSMAALLEELVERAEAEEFWGSFGAYVEAEPGMLDDPETHGWMITPAPLDEDAR
ncbi:hypothetical protein [Thermoactinospora rubra]|uniref:hypothetical protein n=1 Tax=Thermoactinospora rubra TaxID=1088767 RepID=UPI001180E354|nr:hypothetical protein [Thermoactinospora rubra]